ncbi:hypothetical protein BH20ACT13_BH20ACT13_06090 [soil metagenome]
MTRVAYVDEDGQTVDLAPGDAERAGARARSRAAARVREVAGDDG